MLTLKPHTVKTSVDVFFRYRKGGKLLSNNREMKSYPKFKSSWSDKSFWILEPAFAYEVLGGYARVHSFGGFKHL